MARVERGDHSPGRARTVVLNVAGSTRPAPVPPIYDQGPPWVGPWSQSWSGAQRRPKPLSGTRTGKRGEPPFTRPETRLAMSERR